MMSCRGESSRAAATTWPSMARPHTSFSIFGVDVRIRVPSPAARMITVAGPLAVTRLGSSVSLQDWPVRVTAAQARRHSADDRRIPAVYLRLAAIGGHELRALLA